MACDIGSTKFSTFLSLEIKISFYRQLIGQCRRSSFPSLIPSGTCLSAPGDVLFDLLLGHRDIITAFTVTTDGQRVITASRDETVKVFGM